MTIQEAIKKAIEGGYEFERYRDYMAGGPAARAVHFMNPLFWQSLGKAMGWGEGEKYPFFPDKYGGIQMERWRFHWYRFIDRLAEGGTPESFFEQL